jgi:long-chain acyl-CoA synthetase
MLIDLVLRAAEAYPTKPALRCGDDCVSYRELAELAARVANACEAGGLGPDDSVVILLRNSPEFVAALYGVTGMGATAVLLDPASRQHELSHSCMDCRPWAIVTDPAGLERWRSATHDGQETRLALTVGGVANGAREFWSVLEQEPATRTWGTDDDRVATYQYSSGSTGRSKRIGRTHAQWKFETQAFSAAAGHGADDVMVCPVPLFHAYGLGCCLLAAAQVAATVVLQEHTQPFALHRVDTLDLVRRWDATVLPAVPFMFELLASAPGAGPLPSLRFCGSAGAPMTREGFEAFDQRFGIAVRQGYGCTEAGKVTLNVDPDPRPTWSSVGKPLPGIEVAVLDDEGGMVPANTAGRVAIHTPGLTTDHPYDAGGDSPFVGDFFLTGDLGSLDREGRLTISGRTKLFIDVLGEKVDPGEVEEVLGLHPSVRESVVVGVKDGPSGRMVLKAVVVADECDERELIHFCKDRLASYKVPALVEFRDSLPRSQIGKLLRKELI